jgi:acetyl-CoA carboxylase alpha subunit
MGGVDGAAGGALAVVEAVSVPLQEESMVRAASKNATAVIFFMSSPKKSIIPTFPNNATST